MFINTSMPLALSLWVSLISLIQSVQSCLVIISLFFLFETAAVPVFGTVIVSLTAMNA